MSHFDIAIESTGHGRVFLDGVDVSNRLVGFRLEAHVGSATRIALFMAGDSFTAAGEATAQVDVEDILADTVQRVHDAMMAERELRPIVASALEQVLARQNRLREQ